MTTITIKNEAEKAFAFEMIKGNLVPLGALEKYPIDTNKFEDV
jgi:hypothetical protein